VFTLGEHVMPMEPLQDEIVGPGAERPLRAEGRRGTRAAHPVRQSRQPPGARRDPAPRARGAHGAWREPRR
jgi:hypothetical protein